MDDIEASAPNEQLEWLKAALKRRYLIKFLGSTSIGDPDASEKSKHYLGIRTPYIPASLSLFWALISERVDR